MTTLQKLEKLREKAKQKKSQLAEQVGKINSARDEIKALKKEISQFKQEITSLELMQLSETLGANGLTAADVEAAIADGSLKKAVIAGVKADEISDSVKENSEKNRATYSTNSEIKAEEDKKNEVSDS